MADQSCPLGVMSMASRSCSPRRNALDSGGRSYGAFGSAPTSTIRPSNPSVRSVIAARPPPMPAPTIANVRAFIDRAYAHPGLRGSPSIGGLRCRQSLRPLEHLVEHRRCEPPGERVLLARVVAADEPPWSDRGLGAMSEAGLRGGTGAEGGQRAEGAVPCPAAEAHDHACSIEDGDLGLEEGEAR